MTLRDAITRKSYGLSFCTGNFLLKGSYSGTIYYRSWNGRKLKEEFKDFEVMGFDSDLYVTNLSSTICRPCLVIYIGDYDYCHKQ